MGRGLEFVGSACILLGLMCTVLLNDFAMLCYAYCLYYNFQLYACNNCLTFTWEFSLKNAYAAIKRLRLKETVNPKTLGFFSPGAALGGGMFPPM